MEIEWIAIEWLTIVMECAAIVYFLHSRFESKIRSLWPQLLAFAVLIAVDSVYTFGKLLLLEPILTAILFLYLLIAKKGRLLHKVFGVAICLAVSIATSLAGAGLVAVASGASFSDTAYVQGIPRLLTLILIKFMQVAVFYALSKKYLSFRNLQKWPATVLIGTAAIDLICLVLMVILVQDTSLNLIQVSLAAAVAAGLFIVTISIFVLYEMFIRGEMRNLELQTQVQKLELEAHFYQEIDVMYSDMRAWRHDYRNNLLAIQGLLEKREADKALEYIGRILDEPMRGKMVLQTGNTVLDAVVSAKLLLAQAKDIDVTVQVAYPEAVPIKDHDLCAIAGNLIDNAIEACELIDTPAIKRFVDFSILEKGKNMILTVRNSTNGIVRMDGDAYLTTKKGAYHGLGLKHVDSIVEKYQGYVHREHKDNHFETCVLLPLAR